MGFVAITKNINLKISLLGLFLSLSFLSQVGNAQTCDINITSLPYTISQNNTYYCLNQSLYIGGQTAIIISSSTRNVTLDCKGFTVAGNDAYIASGIYLSTQNSTIKNCNVIDFRRGINLVYSSNNITLTNNTANSNEVGIFSWATSNITLTNNTANSNSITGIYITNSYNNTLRNNTMNNNQRYNFDFYEDVSISGYLHDIDASNLVDGKPIYYWVSKSNATIPNDAGFVGVINSTNITVENLTIKKVGRGVLFAYTNKSRIRNTTVSDNNFNIWLFYSDNNTLTNNTINSAWTYGVYAQYSDNNTISGSTINSNRIGIRLHGHALKNASNTVADNTITSGTYGIEIYTGKASTIINNRIERNNENGIRLITQADFNTFIKNNVSSNTYGAYLSNANRANFTQNNLSSNTYNIYVEYSVWLADFNHSIDTTNIINGKPIYYLLDIENQTYDSISAGYFACISCKNITVRNVSSYNNGQGFLFVNTNNSKITNTSTLNNRYGMEIRNSFNNNLTNNLIKWNEEGIRLISSSTNNFTSNTLDLNNYGVSLSSSNSNNLSSNTFRWNNQDIFGGGQNNYTQNLFKDNLNNTMQNFTSTSRTVSGNGTIRFNVSMFYLNGTACPNCNYSITTLPSETVNLSKSGNNLTGNFTATQIGYYSLNVSISDEFGNRVERLYTYINEPKTKTVNYYLRAIDPVNGQPAGVVAKSLLFTPPPSEENISGFTWVQASPDEIPTDPTGVIKNISVLAWYTGANTLRIQRFTYLGGSGDYSSGVTSGTIQNFTNLEWIMDYGWTWYKLGVKLSAAEGVVWKTSATQISYVNITYLYDPIVISNSNPEVKVLSAFQSNNEVMIALEGQGTTSLMVQKPQNVSYNVYYDSSYCNTAICSFTQTTNEMQINLTLGSKVDITIRPFFADGASCSFSSECLSGYCVHGICRSSSTYCGDGYCEGSETCSSCSTDCGCSSGYYCSGNECTMYGGGPAPVSIIESKKIIPLVSPISPAILMIESDKAKTLKIDEVKIEVKEAVSNVQVTVKESSLPTGAIVAISTDVGATYKYIDITTTIPSAKIEKVKIKFKVEKTWITANNIDEEKVALQRYADNKWNKLITAKVSSDATYVYYEVETRALSVFAITGEKKVAVPVEEKKPPVAEEKEAPSQETSLPKIKWYLIGAVILIIIVLVGILHTKKERR